MCYKQVSEKKVLFLFHNRGWFMTEITSINQVVQNNSDGPACFLVDKNLSDLPNVKSNFLVQLREFLLETYIEFVLKSDLENLNEKNYKEEVEKASNCLLKHFNDNKQEYTTNAMNSGLFL